MSRILIFKGAARYEPNVYPRAVLWKALPEEAPDPLACVWVESADNGRTFADVFVLDENGTITLQLAQKENER